MRAVLADVFLGVVQKAVYTVLGTSSFCEIDANYDELWIRAGICGDLDGEDLFL